MLLFVLYCPGPLIHIYNIYNSIDIYDLFTDSFISFICIIYK